MSLITAMWHACSLHGWFLSSVTISSMRRSCRKDSSSATICINSSPTFDFLLSSLELLSCRSCLGAITIGHYRLPRNLLLEEPGRQKDMWCKIGLPSHFQQAWHLTWKGKLIYGCWCSLLKLQLRGRNPPRTVGASLGPRTYPKQTSKLTAHTGLPKKLLMCTFLTLDTGPPRIKPAFGMGPDRKDRTAVRRHPSLPKSSSHLLP